MSNELSKTCEMIDIEQATAMAGYEPPRQEQILLSIIHEREMAFKRLMQDHDHLRSEYYSFREESNTINLAHRAQIADLQDRLNGTMRNIFDRQTAALEAIAGNLDFMSRKP